MSIIATIIHQPSTIIDHHQPSTIIIHYPPSSFIIHQPSSTFTNNPQRFQTTVPKNPCYANPPAAAPVVNCTITLKWSRQSLLVLIPCCSPVCSANSIHVINHGRNVVKQICLNSMVNHNHNIIQSIQPYMHNIYISINHNECFVNDYDQWSILDHHIMRLQTQRFHGSSPHLTATAATSCSSRWRSHGRDSGQQL